MLDALVGVVVVLLVVAGILVMLGPKTLEIVKRVRSIRRPSSVPAVFQAARPREVVPPGLNPKTQRVLVGAARLASWLRSHGHDDLSRELRTAAARMTTNEPAGLYAMQNVLRRIRSLSLDDRGAQERLKSMSAELRTAVQDRFEQLELLPFRRP
jgi:hypothetical protein